ncbi:MAG: beta-ketoacyl-ACP synthase II [Planctomycetota bacterium]|nr:beta-ketoacyl-ACP synthase II [Planctomycetota bacterium]
MAGNRRRVVVTGLGAVTPLAIGARPTWDALLAGKSGAAAITHYDHARHGVHFACEVKNFAPEQFVEKREARRIDPFALFGVAAAKEAVLDSKLDFSKEDTRRAGTVMGTGMGGMTEFEEQKERLMTKGPERVSPFLVPKMMPNAAAGYVSIMHGLRGPCFCTVTACASGANALGEALRLIQHGAADIMVAGGCEAVVTPLTMAGFENMGAISKRNDNPEAASRPFDKDRDGFVMGEGAGVLVLEELEHALKRDARIYAEFVGYGMSGDAFHITSPCEDGDGGIRAMQDCLADAGLRVEDVDYINAHGTSTPINDRVETLAIKKTFGDRAKKIPVNSTKSMTGHMIGAAGGLEAVVSVLSVAEDRVHRTLNYTTPDPELDLDYVPEGTREVKVRAAISNSLGFGGHNATLAFAKLKL